MEEKLPLTITNTIVVGHGATFSYARDPCTGSIRKHSSTQTMGTLTSFLMLMPPQSKIPLSATQTLA